MGRKRPVADISDYELQRAKIKKADVANVKNDPTDGPKK